MIEIIEGVSLSQYAGVTAAVADEVPLDEVLAHERVASSDWPPIDAAWKEAIAVEGVDGPTFKAFAAKRAEAEDWLARPVKPLDDDLAAWMRFLRAYGEHAAPFEMLTAAGMRLADLARLQRRWTKRFTEDRELAKRAVELQKQPPAPPPPIAVGTLVLKPFPWSPGAAPAAEPEATTAAELAGDTAELPLDRYAALCVELSEPKADRAKIAARYGIEPARLDEVDAAWKARIAADPALERDFRQLHAYQRSRLAAAAKFVPRDPNAPPPALTGTALALDRPMSLVLPFTDGEAPPEIAAPSAAPKPRPASSLAGTALAVDVPRGPALPFGGHVEPAPAPVAAPSTPKLAGTALAIDVPSGPDLPFVEGEASPEVIAHAEEPAPKPQARFTGTADLNVPADAKLPFAPSPGTTTPTTPATPKVAAPVMTIQQYASFCVELEQGVEAEVLARYRIRAEERVALDEAFTRRFAQVPAQRKAFDVAKETYRAWLAQTRR